MKNIFCISGLGANETSFSNLKIEGYNLKVIQWLPPFLSETIQEYTKRMRSFITEDNPILMGLSFGGMICIEIAKQIKVDKIIIISSVKNSNEIPRWMKLASSLKLNKILPLRSNISITQPLQNYFLGIKTQQEKNIVTASRKRVDMEYINWSVNQAINWQNDWVHPNIFHIHGDNDKMFPLKYIKPTFVIKNGGHFMIYNRADEVSNYINKSLQC